MNNNRILLSGALVALFVSLSPAAWLRSLHDGQTGEWLDWPVLATDPAGDGTPDLLLLQAARDESSLSFRLQTGNEFLLQEGNGLRMLLDTDFNSSTGIAAEGLGAELQWIFASRSGTFRWNNLNTTVQHEHLGLRSLPTHTGSDFEIVLDLDALPDGSHPLFPLDSLRAVFHSPSGDRIPTTGSVIVRLGAGSLQSLETIDLPRSGDGSLRLMSWNTEFGGLFDEAARPAYTRLLTAAAPDVIVFEEIWDQGAAQVQSRLQLLVPDLGQWTAVKRDAGNVIAARHPIRNSWLIQDNYRETAALIDVSSILGDSLLLIGCHLRCCSANTERQEEADGLVEFLHDARNPGGAITLPAGTPMVLTGDFNLVGDRRQLLTLLTGDIMDEGSYGPDSPPDWNGGPLTDLFPRHLSGPDVYTWNDAGSAYLPGRLDLILYTPSALEAVRSGAIWTPGLSDSLLSAWGLQAGDAPAASDHMPVFADFRLPVTTPTAPDLHLERLPTSQLRLSWQAVPQASAYRLQSRSALDAAWEELGNTTATQVILPTPASADLRLYRAFSLRSGAAGRAATR